jgi:hypothetical protein
VLAKLNASCGTLTVPENRNSTSQATLQLPVAIIPSVTQPSEPDPIVFMAGGPGQDALNQAPALVRSLWFKYAHDKSAFIVSTIN